MGVWHEPPGNWWFLSNGDFMVSWCIGSREDLISSWRNNFYDFCSLSSLITLPYQHFTYVVSHLIRIETIINIPLICKLQNLVKPTRTPYERLVLELVFSRKAFTWSRTLRMQPVKLIIPSMHILCAPYNSLPHKRTRTFNRMFSGRVFLARPKREG